MSAAAAVRSHEVLDLVSDADDDADQHQPLSASGKWLSPPLSPSRSPPHHAMSDSEAVSASSSPRKRRRLSASPAASADGDCPSVRSLSSRDSGAHSGSDGDDDVIHFSDVEADAPTTSVLHTSAASAPSTPAAGPGELVAAASTAASSASSASKRRKQAVARYFGGEDLSLKCFNCGAAGHKSEECPVDKPCYICGQSLATHAKKRGCPNEPCWRCGGIGHQKSECTAARFLPRLCYRCGSTSHDVSRCTTPPSSSFWDLSAVHCYVCGSLGHINCSPSSFSSTPLYCCNCASPYHSWLTCRQDRLSRDVQVEEYSGGGSAYKRSMECFRCGQIGHSKAECTWSGSRGRYSGGGGSTAIVGRSGGAGGMRLSFSRAGGGGHATSGRSASEKGSSSASSSSGARRSRSRDRDDRQDRHRSTSHRSSSNGTAWRSDRERSGEREHYVGRKRKR